jgi:phosphopantetheinyl transferase (holo-ACP synthase)
MGIMQIQLQEVTLEHDALHEELGACQRKCLGLEQENANQHKAIKEAFIKAIHAEKECLNFVEDIEHYHQTWIYIKE